MDFLKDKLQGASGEKPAGEQTSAGGGGFMDKINGALGGGKSSEVNEDALDKAVDYVQKSYFGGGDQSNESAIEQAKDEQISDAIRTQYKNITGSDFPVKDKS